MIIIIIDYYCNHHHINIIIIIFIIIPECAGGLVAWKKNVHLRLGVIKLVGSLGV